MIVKDTNGSIRGRFTDVKKHSRYCFITASDGREYFCHINDFCNKKEWRKYVWNGNWCTFIHSETHEEGKHRTAFAIVPDHKEKPEI